MTSLFLTTAVARVEISPLLGGAILAYDAKLHSQFVPILRNANKAKSVLETSCFPLVPYSNRIKHGHFNWQEKSITLPLNNLPEKHSIHGHGWQLPWTVTQQTDNSLTIEYHHQTAQWPFSYSAQQTFTLDNNSLEIELVLLNTSNTEMPSGLGLHPYFSLTNKSYLKCSVDKMWAVDDENIPTELIDIPNNINTPTGMLIKGSNLDNVFTHFSGNATVYWPEWQAKASITTSTNCKFIVLYSPRNEGYFCLEPVTHCTDAINMANNGVDNTGIKYLQPQEKMTVSMRISPDELSIN
ncbi:MAG: aldose 1-epimerase [Psychroserpens sp.]|jgi:aldose 1-epimerase